MKQILIFALIFFSLTLSAQRDTLDVGNLRTYISSDTANVSGGVEIELIWLAPNFGHVTELDTLGGDKLDAIDEVIASLQSDSLSLQQNLESLYYSYVYYNTLFINTVRRLAEYWAIKP